MANEIFIIQFEFIYRALALNIENITQEESVMFPEAGGNCVNWMLAILNEESIWNDETVSCYKRGINAAAEKGNFLQWQQLLNYLSHTQTLILKT